MIVYPEEMERMMDEIFSWKLPTGRFRADTPQEIFDMEKYIVEWTASEMDGVM